MVQIVQILNGLVWHVYPEYTKLSDTIGRFAPDILFVEAPDYVTEQWRYDTSSGTFTAYEGYWESVRARERADLHEATTNDTMQALRKIRESDSSMDWSAWLDALDAYNAAIEATKEQEGYPDRVEYPPYPTHPDRGDPAQE